MTDTHPASLGKRLRQERELRHWTQEELAERIGRSVPSINRWEHDRAEPQADALQELTALFGKPPDRWGTSRWNVPFLRNPYFTGREQLLSRLHRTLAAENTVTLSQTRAISGLGGIGKTQIAIEYAYRYAREYEAVLWVQADSPELQVSDFARLAQTLELPEQQEQEQWRIVNAVKRWLQEHSGWLLILDNADDVSVITDVLPRGVSGATLVTTRSQVTGKIARNISVEKMEMAEGIRLLLRRATLLAEDEPLETVSAATRSAARRLVEELDGLPLALDQAGAYIEETGCSLSEYLALFKQHRLALLKRESSTVSEYPHTVASTWTLSFSQVEQANPAAADLLRLCAFLHPDAIPEEILTAGSAALGPYLQYVVSEPLLLNEAIQLLRRYSLVKRDAEAKLLNLHRLVQVVLKESLDPPMQRQWAERALLAVNAAFPSSVEYSVWPQCERLLSQALTAAQLIEQYQIVSAEAGHLLHEMAIYLRDRARYAEAEPLFQQAVRIREQQLGPAHPDVASSLHRLASLYADQGKYAEAESFYQRALRIREQQLGSDHPDVADSFNSLGAFYKDQGKYAEAEPLYQRALHIWEQHLGLEHPRVAYPLNNLAELYREQGKYAEAEPLYQRASHILEQLGSDHPAFVTVLGNLAILYFEQGKHAEAELLYQRVLHIREPQLGSEHPDVATPLTNLANIYVAQSRYAEAEPLYQRALHIWEQHLGLEHPLVAHPLNGLARLYAAQGKYAEAEPLHQRVLHIWEQQLGLEHPDTAEALHDFAAFEEMRGNQQEACSLYQRALDIREQVLGPEHPKTRATRQHLMALLYALGQLEEVAQREQKIHEEGWKAHSEE